MPGNKLFIIMRTNLSEALPALIPEFPVEIAGHHLTLRFDVNINKTKKGVKLQFVMKDIPQDPRQAQQMANEIGTELQQKFGDAGLQVVYDVENPYKNVIGFLLPLPSLANYLIKNIFKSEENGEMTQQTPADDSQEEPAAEPLPDQEQAPASEEDQVREIMMNRAGLK
jgi:hypothetical protein